MNTWIKITDNKYKYQCWYSDKIGEYFQIFKSEKYHFDTHTYTYVYYVNDTDYVFMVDCEIINRKEKLERILCGTEK